MTCVICSGIPWHELKLQLDCWKLSFRSSKNRRCFLQKGTASATAALDANSKGTFRTCFTLTAARSSPRTTTPAWLSEDRDRSVLHYGENIEIRLRQPMDHLVLRAEHSVARGQHSPHFGAVHETDSLWQVMHAPSGSSISSCQLKRWRCTMHGSRSCIGIKTSGGGTYWTSTDDWSISRGRSTVFASIWKQDLNILCTQDLQAAIVRSCWQTWLSWLCRLFQQIPLKENSIWVSQLQQVTWLGFNTRALVIISAGKLL